MSDIRIDNYADLDRKHTRPDTISEDAIVIKVYRETDRITKGPEWEIRVEKNPDTGEVTVTALDLREGADTRLVLGEPGYYAD